MTGASWLERILAVTKGAMRNSAMRSARRMGAPTKLAHGSQAGIGVGHLQAMIEVLRTFRFEQRQGASRLVLEPVGVCALITPWNWPINQVAAKVVPALAAGCTMILKPSEYSPFSAILWAKFSMRPVFRLAYSTWSWRGIAGRRPRCLASGR